MFWLKFISKFIKVLRSGESPALIAGGFAVGFFIGLTPFLTLQNIILLIIVILTKINLAAVFFALFLFSFIAYLFDPLFHDLGYFMLAQINALTDLWTAFYNMPFVPLTRFNNTIVMGSVIVALVLAFPLYLLAKKGIVAYRSTIGPKIEKSKFVKAIKSSTLYRWYVKVRDLEFS